MHQTLKIFLAIVASSFLCLIHNDAQAQYSFKRENNPLVKHIYTADPSARVFNNRLYVYTSHDESKAKYFNMLDWYVFSTDNLNDWTDHGPIFSLEQIKWAKKWAWAPDCVERKGKYYFYFPVERSKIGVAVSDSPTGPFVDKLEKPLIDNTNQIELIGEEPIDPAILMDKSNTYLYFGCRKLRVVKLKKNMMETDGEVMKLEIKGIENDKENFGGYYGEGPWVFKRNNLYYLMYSNGWGEKSTLVYAIAKNPLGPFEFVGEVMDPVDSFTSHGSIIEFNNKWYIFYHNMSLSKNNYRRSICFDEINFDQDGKIIKLKLQN